MKRIFDLVFSFLGILIFSPVLIVISFLIVIDSKGGVFYQQERVGLGGRIFYVLKFRTMRPDSFSKGALTIGSRDPRITIVGYYLRKYKWDEMPQLFNVFVGDMSFVGPRPEVKMYTDLYSDEQRKVLSVLPGITDYASIKFRNENDLLATSVVPGQLYIEEIMPEKLNLNMKYINERSMYIDVKIIFETFYTIVKHS